MNTSQQTSCYVYKFTYFSSVVLFVVYVLRIPFLILIKEKACTTSLYKKCILDKTFSAL